MPRFVLFASSTYCDSWFCRLEVSEALRQNKPILVVYDSNSDFPQMYIHSVDDFLTKLFRALSGNTLESSLTMELFRAQFQSVTEFGIRVGSRKREEMLQSIVSAAGHTLPVLNENRVSIADIYLVGHPVTGEASCELIAQELKFQRNSGKISGAERNYCGDVKPSL